MQMVAFRPETKEVIMSYLSTCELVELIEELPFEFQPKDVQEFVEYTEEFGVPFDDIEWFIRWIPELLPCIEYSYKPYGYFEIFEDWDAYIAAGYDCHDDDPYQPLDATVVEDAGLSGTWYIQLY